MDKLLTIVVPCYNEAFNIPLFFPKLRAFAEENNYALLAVNDGSLDNTGDLLNQLAEKSELKVLHHKCNCGYGAALKTGLKAVETEYAITVDADGQHRLQDISRCFNYLQEHNLDLVVGARTNDASGFYRNLGKWMIRMFAKSLLTLPVKDLNSGMKCYRMCEAKAYLSLCPDTMAFSDVILLLMINDNKSVSEIPIQVEPRLKGVSTIGTRTAFVTIAEIMNLSVLLRPMTTFFRLGLFFGNLGIILSIFTYLKSSTITPAAVMMIMLGLVCFVLGLLGEQLSQIRKHLAGLKK